MKALPILSAVLLIAQSTRCWSVDASREMGQELYESKGANSCLYCHGVDGKKGKVAASANLSTPKSWKSFKALGGESAFSADKSAFGSKLKQAVVQLIKDGAIRHNATYKEAGFNWDAPGMSKFNAQMMGLNGAASQQWLKRMTERGVTPDVAANSLWLYLQTLDSEGVLQ